MSTSSGGKKSKKLGLRGLLKNPLFYFGLFPFILLGFLFYNSESLAQLSHFKGGNSAFLNSYFRNNEKLDSGNLFFNQNKTLALEPPDLKIIQDNSIFGISTPRILTTQTLGDIFGESPGSKKEVTDYYVQPGDTIKSLAQTFRISENTIVWTNELPSAKAPLKTGQHLIILPISGYIHVVKQGDTLSQIAKSSKAKIDDIIAINYLANEFDIFIGDPLIIPNGIKPPSQIASNPSLPNSFFIYPAEGVISQGLHYYNAIDVANKCGTSVHAAASGVVQRARFDYRYGNYVTILHSNGVVTYYGHLQTIFVKTGDSVTVGDRIASMGNTGSRSTGCHLHFGVSGDRNPLALYSLGASIRYK